MLRAFDDLQRFQLNQGMRLLTAKIIKASQVVELLFVGRQAGEDARPGNANSWGEGFAVNLGRVEVIPGELED